MRSKILNLIVAASFLLFAGASQAGTLTSATWNGSFQGTPFTITTAGGGLTASGTSVGMTANVQITVAPRLSSSLNTAGTAPVFISQTLGGSQAIAITAGGPSANQGIAGLVNVFIGNNSNGTQLFSVPLTVGFPVANPFFVNQTAVVPGLNIPVSVTASAFPWTTGVVSISGLTNSSAAIPNFVLAGANSLTAGGGGSITLVAPAITTVCAGAIFQSPQRPCVGGAPAGGTQKSHTASATTLTLNFVGAAVPEPGTLLLLGAGLMGLAAVGRRKQS